jgi:hypothetical protein
MDCTNFNRLPGNHGNRSEENLQKKKKQNIKVKLMNVPQIASN